MKLSKQQQEEAVHRYVAGENSNAIAKSMNVHGMTVLRSLERSGLPRRKAEEYNRSFTCNHAYFSNIATQEQAYWLGFLAADGCVACGNLIWMELQKSDFDHLRRFKQSISSTHTIMTDHRRARFGVRSDQMVEDLDHYSITPRKARTVAWPKLSQHLYPHYLRGYFDGDGCICLNKQVNRSWRPSLMFTITSNLGLLTSAQEYLIEELSLNKTKIIQHPGQPFTFNLRYGGEYQVMKIMNLLYLDATLCLPRKANVIVEYLDDYPAFDSHQPRLYQSVREAMKTSQALLQVHGELASAQCASCKHNAR